MVHRLQVFGMTNSQQLAGMPGKRYRTEGGSRPSNVSRLRRLQTRGKRYSGRKARNAIVNVPRNKMGFPQEMRASLRYVDSLDFVPTSHTTVRQTFLANGLYDPHTSTGGHQPRGFDEFMAIYNKFTVKSSKISVTFTYEGYNGPYGSTATGAPSQLIGTVAPAPAACPPAVGIVRASGELSTSGTVSDQQEIDKAKWVTITPQGEAKTVSTSTSPRAWFGKDFLVGSDGYTGTDSTDPTNLCYYHILMGLQHNEYSQNVKLRANVCITYDAVFTEPKPLAQS